MHTKAEFYTNLLTSINSKKALDVLKLTINIITLANKKQTTFWRTLHALDKKQCVYGKAVVAAAALQDEEPLTDKLHQLQITHGSGVYNQLPDGIFIMVKVHGKKAKTLLSHLFS